MFVFGAYAPHPDGWEHIATSGNDVDEVPQRLQDLAAPYVRWGVQVSYVRIGEFPAVTPPVQG